MSRNTEIQFRLEISFFLTVSMPHQPLPGQCEAVLQGVRKLSELDPLVVLALFRDGHVVGHQLHLVSLSLDGDE